MSDASPLIRNNAIRFVSDDAEAAQVWLEAEGEFELTAGVKPNLNRFTCFYPDFAVIQQRKLFNGRLEFFHTEEWEPADGGPEGPPDVVLERMQIYDAEVLDVGVIAGFTDGPAGITRVRVYVADRRADLCYPMGGVVDRGELNKRPFSEDGANDANGNPVLNAWFLAHMCVYAMGLADEVAVPLAIKDGPPPMDVEWRGNHAPTELEAILDENGFAFTLDAKGRYAIVPRNGGPQPSFPPGAIRTPNLGVERRGEVIVFGSHPYPVTDTVTLSGPGDYKKPKETDELEYVFFNPTTGKPIPLSQASKELWHGVDPARIPFFDYVEDFDPVWTKVAKEGVFKCIRINPKNPSWGDTPMLASITRDKNQLSKRVRIEAIVPQRGKDGRWRNSAEKVPLYAVNLIDEGRVLVFWDHLMKVDPQYDADGVAHPTKFLVPLGPGDMSVTATVEDATKDDDGRWVPEYFYVGYKARLGGIEKLTESELRLVLKDPKTPIVPRPDLRLHRRDGIDQNRAQLEDAANNLAYPYVAGSGEPTARVVVPGFAGYTPDARISRVRISQNPPVTTVDVNTWYYPHGSYLFRDKRSGPNARKDEGEKFPKQNDTAAARAAQGVAGAAAPATVLYPFPPAQEAGETGGIVKIVGKEAGGGKYKGKLLTGSAKVTPDGDLPAKTVEGTTAEEGMVEGADALVVNLDEASALGVSGPQNPTRKTHDLYPGGSQVSVYARGEIVGQTKPAEGSAEVPRPIVLIRVPNPFVTFVVALAKDDGEQGTKSTPATWKYTVTSLNGEVLGTKLAPKRPRANGTYNVATQGLAYYDAERKLQLAEAWETEGTTYCGAPVGD